MYLAVYWVPVLSVIRTSSGALPKLLACQVAPKPFCMLIQSPPCIQLQLGSVNVIQDSLATAGSATLPLEHRHLLLAMKHHRPQMWALKRSSMIEACTGRNVCYTLHRYGAQMEKHAAAAAAALHSLQALSFSKQVKARRRTAERTATPWKALLPAACTTNICDDLRHVGAYAVHVLPQRGMPS